MRTDRVTSEFGCVRFRQSAFSRLANEAGRAGCMSINGTISASAFAASETTCLRYIQGLKEQFGESFDAIHLMDAKTLRQQVVLHAAYISAGQQTFQFSTDLIDSFKRTDLAGTPIGHLRLPYAAGFLHFGRQEDLEINDVFRHSADFVDGAYFHCGPEGQLTVQLTMSKRTSTGFLGLCGPHFTASKEALSLDAHGALQVILDAEVESASADADSENAVRAAMIEWNASHTQLLHSSLSLVLNALFYLDAYGADSNELAPESVPQALRLAFEKATASNKAKAIREVKNQILADGFSTVRLCGRVQSNVDAEIGSKFSSEVRMHWRRGHWRMQPSGPRLSMIKRVWVRPSLVGKGDADGIPGHQYIVQSVH